MSDLPTNVVAPNLAWHVMPRSISASTSFLTEARTPSASRTLPSTTKWFRWPRFFALSIGIDLQVQSSVSNREGPYVPNQAQPVPQCFDRA